MGKRREGEQQEEFHYVSAVCLCSRKPNSAAVVCHSQFAQWAASTPCIPQVRQQRQYQPITFSSISKKSQQWNTVSSYVL